MSRAAALLLLFAGCQPSAAEPDTPVPTAVPSAAPACPAGDPSTGRWSASATLPRLPHASAFPLRDRILVHGGWPGTLGRFDPATGGWETLPSNPAGDLEGSALAFDATPGQEKLFLAGGSRPEAHVWISGEVMAFDVSSSTWLFYPSLPEPRAGAAAFLHRGQLIVAGGERDNASGASDTIFTYDLGAGTTGTWKAADFLPEPRSYAAVASDGLRVYLLGGTFNHYSEPIVPLESQTLVFDLQSLSWSTLPAPPTPRHLASATWSCGRLWLVGGGSEDRPPSDAFEILDPGTGLWSGLPALPEVRSKAALVPWGGKLLLLGGLDATNLPTTSVMEFSWP